MNKKIVNKRNAIIGFIVVKVGKRLARKKAKQLKQKLPSRGGKSSS